MILKNLLSQSEVEAYIMEGKDYKQGHPTYHPFVMRECNSDYLVVHHSVSPPCSPAHTIVSKRLANNYMLMNATDEEKQRLIAANYQMIGLK